MKKKLSILMPTLGHRAKSFLRIRSQFQDEIERLNLKNEVEILSLMDDYELTTGKKRNMLMEQAKGEYVVFCDDDDIYNPRYVEHVFNYMGGDVIGITGMFTYQRDLIDKLTSMSWEDLIKHPQVHRFTHSIEYHTYFRDKKGVYCRPPVHTNPMRRRIAMAVRFPETCLFEDVVYTHLLVRLGLYKSERMIPEPLFFYTPGAPEHENKPNQPTPDEKTQIMKEWGVYE